jgi:ribosome-associated protein
VQYLGKLLREIDLTSAYQTMDQLKNGSQIEIRKNHIVEEWRDRLIRDKDALTELIHKFPDIDRQLIRQLIQNTIKERENSKPPKFYRQIFQYLKEHIV